MCEFDGLLEDLKEVLEDLESQRKRYAAKETAMSGKRKAAEGDIEKAEGYLEELEVSSNLAEEEGVPVEEVVDQQVLEGARSFCENNTPDLQQIYQNFQPSELEPKTAEGDSHRDDELRFVSHHADFGHDDFGFKLACTSTEWPRLVDSLKSYRTQTWGEILENEKTNNGPMEISRIEACAQNRLRELDYLEPMEWDPLFKLRVNKQVRLWGKKFGREFHILWYDKDHLVYESDH